MQKRISAVIPDELYDQLKLVSEKSSRSVNFVITQLLNQGIKEKKRKSVKKKSFTADNPSD